MRTPTILCGCIENSYRKHLHLIEPKWRRTDVWLGDGKEMSAM